MFPGADLVETGFADLAAGRETIESLLVSIGAPRLETIGNFRADDELSQRLNIVL